MQKLQGEKLSSDRLMKCLLLTIASTLSWPTKSPAIDGAVHLPLSQHPISGPPLIQRQRGAAAIWGWDIMFVNTWLVAFILPSQFYSRFKIPEKFWSKFRFRAFFQDFWSWSRRNHFFRYRFFPDFLIKETEMWLSYHQLLNINDLR
jgi:hypothetical protein